MGRMGKMGQLSHFSPVFLLFPINFTQFLYISQNVLLAISHYSQFFSISPHFRPVFHFPRLSKPLRLGG